MTQSEELKPVKCRCGKGTVIKSFEQSLVPRVSLLYYRVECDSHGHCWRGPIKKPESEAIQAWNEVMEVK